MALMKLQKVPVDAGAPGPWPAGIGSRHKGVHHRSTDAAYWALQQQ